MTARQLTDAFGHWRKSGKSMVLASVYETAGSTYSKAGAQMLINSDGDFQGMLSGGCLEGDLAERARQVLESGVPQIVTYDLGQNDDELWGLGVGCDGLMKIFLQPLRAENGYEPFATMVKIFGGDDSTIAATVLEADDALNTPGASLIVARGQLKYCDVQGDVLADVLRMAGDVQQAGLSVTRNLCRPGGKMKLLFAILRPPPRVLVLGAGLDAGPLVRLITELGWRVIVQDHRPAYIEAGDFSEAEQVFCVAADELPAKVDLDRIDAAVVMSHHLDTDRKYLAMLAPTSIRYVALLGPPNRRVRLITELGDKASALQGRLHGPAGMDIGASGPASIALSIVAQMHHVLMSG
ncbi:MAG: XdhC family protein [Gammaproteobacteria bacterium]|nr:XdhC family protein [Gammaproteobacteria bacterium]